MKGDVWICYQIGDEKNPWVCVRAKSGDVARLNVIFSFLILKYSVKI